MDSLRHMCLRVAPYIGGGLLAVGVTAFILKKRQKPKAKRFVHFIIYYLPGSYTHNFDKPILTVRCIITELGRNKCTRYRRVLMKKFNMVTSADIVRNLIKTAIVYSVDRLYKPTYKPQCTKSHCIWFDSPNYLSYASLA